MKRLVVARYQEDITWLDKVHPSWTKTVVQKKTDEEQGDVPNRGREATSYLHAILKYYDQIKPKDIWAFLQGDPFPHSVNIIDQLEIARGIDGFTPFGGSKPVVVTWKATGKKEVYSEPFTSDENGNPTHPGLPVGLWYTKWSGKAFPEDGVFFYPGAQFLVDGKTLRSRPPEWYRAIFEDTMAENDATPYVLERLWLALFSV